MNDYYHDYEELHIWTRPKSTDKVIVAIHNTNLGPALGGTRWENYSTGGEAIEACFRLSKGMTYKAALAGVNNGGGKAVLHAEKKTKKLLEFAVECYDSLDGRFITGEDAGMTAEDIRYMKRCSTRNIVSDTDSSPYTAHGLMAALKGVMGSTGLRDGFSVAVRGIGHCGMHWVKLLADLDECGKIYVTDRYGKQYEKLYTFISTYNGAGMDKVEWIKTNHIYTTDADIFSPCALGGSITPAIAQILKKGTIILGAENNQIFEEDFDHVNQLMGERNILYIPDFVANAGGLIGIVKTMEATFKEAMDSMNIITHNVSELIQIHEETREPTQKIAYEQAEKRWKNER